MKYFEVLLTTNNFRNPKWYVTFEYLIYMKPESIVYALMRQKMMYEMDMFTLLDYVYTFYGCVF